MPDQGVGAAAHHRLAAVLLKGDNRDGEAVFAKHPRHAQITEDEQARPDGLGPDRRPCAVAAGVPAHGGQPGQENQAREDYESPVPGLLVLPDRRAHPFPKKRRIGSRQPKADTEPEAPGQSEEHPGAGPMQGSGRNEQQKAEDRGSGGRLDDHPRDHARPTCPRRTGLRSAGSGRRAPPRPGGLRRRSPPCCRGPRPASSGP